ncbi:MAG TPA: MaoC family dehydratase N-terminal domain-containing protein [Dehalococcoidia bacterium]|nr:MaoC family dehydratase N-terminal domain-containing protein [Dehalococcoidia bacterium]
MAENEESLLLPEATAMVGKDGPPFTVRIEYFPIKKYAQAIAWPEPPNPLYVDEEYAKKTRYGGIIAPPTFATLLNREAPDLEVPLKPYKVGLNGGTEHQIHQPIRPGMVLTGRKRLAELKERKGKSPMVITVIETNYVDEQGKPVVTTRDTGIRVYEAQA